MSIWMTTTILYVAFIAILSGVTKVYLPDLVYLGKIPIDPQYAIWMLGIMLWIPISLMMQAYFKRD